MYVDTILLEDWFTESHTERYLLQAENSEDATAWLVPENRTPQNQGEQNLSLRLGVKDLRTSKNSYYQTRMES